MVGLLVQHPKPAAWCHYCWSNGHYDAVPPRRFKHRPLTLRAYTALVAETLQRGGWTFVKPGRLARELRDLAAGFEVGDIMERQDDEVTARVRARPRRGRVRR